MNTDLNRLIDRSWTLFLDRDGVINVRKHNEYVRTPEEFVFIPGVTNALAVLSQIFPRIVVVTNQQGIGKGLYSIDDLHSIHKKMVGEIERSGGRIDAIYFAPQLSSENSKMRKPGTGMAIEAQAQFPEIDFSKSIMVGDTISDMEFGRNSGMKVVLCTPESLNFQADMHFNSLEEFASYIAAQK